MKSLSALKDGNFYYIKTLEIVNECFVDALGGLISVIGFIFNFNILNSLKCQTHMQTDQIACL